MKLCHVFFPGSLPWPAPNDGIRLEQHEDKDKRFRVTYGLQVEDHLGYEAACMELGTCILHKLACDGEVDNEGAYK